MTHMCRGTHMCIYCRGREANGTQSHTHGVGTIYAKGLINKQLSAPSAPNRLQRRRLIRANVITSRRNTCTLVILRLQSIARTRIRRTTCFDLLLHADCDRLRQNCRRFCKLNFGDLKGLLEKNLRSQNSKCKGHSFYLLNF